MDTFTVIPIVLGIAGPLIAILGSVLAYYEERKKKNRQFGEIISPVENYGVKNVNATSNKEDSTRMIGAK